jgi:hypothetical protein
MEQPKKTEIEKQLEATTAERKKLEAEHQILKTTAENLNVIATKKKENQKLREENERRLKGESGDSK